MRLNRLCCAGLAALMCAASCSVVDLEGGQENRSADMSPAVMEGELLIKFSLEVSAVLDANGMTKSSSSAPMTRSGIPSVDEILELAGNYQFERVFPVDPRHEERTREDGLHLWYVVRFDKTRPVEEVAAELSALGEISDIQYNFQIKRAYTGKAYPLKFPAARPVTKASASPFGDELFHYQWNLVNDGNFFSGTDKAVAGADVRVADAWKLSAGDPSIVVAVLDEGICYDHPDLAESMWVNEDEIWRSREDNDGNGYAGDYHGYNFVSESGIISYDSIYDSGHGTHVAGIIAARNNGTGICSIAGGDKSGPGVKIMSCQIFSGQNVASVLAEVRAIKYAADNGAVILQCSWGYVSGTANSYDWTPQYATDEQWETNAPLEKMALEYFIHNAGSPSGVIDGGLAIFASGNEYAPSAGYPGAYKDFVSVAATAADYTPAVYTNYGPGTTISAPGGDQDYYWDWTGDQDAPGLEGCILSTLPYQISSTGYGFMEGTSMATPHVSAVAALGLSYAAKLRKHFTADEFKELLHSTATPIDEYITGTKVYHRYISEAGDSAPVMQMDLADYRGKMGGQVNAVRLLEAIGGEDAGTPMKFPNILVGAGSEVSLAAAMYFDGGENLSYTVSVSDVSIASASVEDGKVTVKGLSAGQTSASIKASDGTVQNFVITVRSGAGNGWL